MSDSPDSAIRKTVSLPAGLWRQIEDYQFANRIKRETEALRRLIEFGLKATSETPEPETRGVTGSSRRTARPRAKA